ncbi:hypothetical protein SAMN05216559_4000 [Halomicrobium zhouii]|uniref:DUF7981 domain-containing protein n=1 Tax=Halomicrobium zhouii TaxID=767519 RepID=A0A1I6M921_9EURY|nr:hypothetical protein [Halomicrobium zhouii]SFS12042.1 hypothetical protein SAMN05216559_4000 [Halomicrobium zhouii]
MDPRTKSRLLWGVVGLLSFLVLIQAYELATSDLVDWGVKLGVAVVVGIAAALVTGQSQKRLVEDEADSRSTDATENESP